MERGRFYQQFGETSGSGEAGSQEAQTSGIVPKEQSWYEQDIPHEHVVAALRGFAERARISYGETKEEFDTATWLEWELRTQAVAAYNGDAPQEEQMFFNELMIGWNAFAYHKFGRKLLEYRVRGIKKEIQDYMQWSQSTSIALHPKAVKLFDAMAEVSGIPRRL